MIRLELTEAHLNRLLEKANVTYQEGCFVVHRKLPLGAASLVAVPTLEGRELALYLPFDQIRGNLTGGLMGQLAKMLWGVLSDQVLKQVAPRLVAQGLPSDTVDLDQVTFQGKKAGRISLSLTRVNEWLARQNWVEPMRLAVDTLSFQAGSVAVCLELKGAGPA